MVGIKKRILLCLFCLNGLVISQLSAQSRTVLSLQEAYALLEARYPALRNAGVIREIHANRQAQLDRDRLPSIHLKADGRLQSESARLEVPEGTPLPFEIDLPLYSVRTYVEARYNILDGGMTCARRSLEEAQQRTGLQQVAVDRYALQQRVNALFLSIRLFREQVGLLAIVLDDLSHRRQQLVAGVENGILLESELKKLEVKILERETERDGLQASLGGMRRSLEDLLGIQLTDSVALTLPDMGDPALVPEIARPEQRLFQLQRSALLARKHLIAAGRRPRLSAYAQGGAGYPNPLNFLDANFSPYGLVGFQFSWQLNNWKHSRLQKRETELEARKLEHAEATLTFNLDSKAAAYRADVDRLAAQIARDRQIVALQAEILQQSTAQLEEGVITVAEYLSQSNAELSARQRLLIRQAELLKIQLEFRNERGAI